LSIALNQRLSTSLNDTTGQSITTVEADLANAQGALSSAKDRHAQTSATLGDFLTQISGVSNEEVGSQILALQTRMQASMQTTAMLFQTSLVNYLK
jgi:flagellar hook-associated protein 3 FlgL